MIPFDECEVLDFLNNDNSLDLYHQNLYLQDFYDIANKLECKYYTENSFSLFLEHKVINKHLIFLNINARSLASNFTGLLTFLDSLSHKPDIIVIEEIWQIIPEYYNLPDFNLFCNSRQNGRGGGVLIFVRKKYQSVLLHEIKFYENILEAIAIEVHIPNAKKFICVALYRPNTHRELSSSRQMEIFFDEFRHLLSKLDSLKLPVYICTDKILT